MAKTELHGKGGMVQLDASNVELVVSWNLSVDTSTVKSTPLLGSTKCNEYTSVLYDWTATVTTRAWTGATFGATVAVILEASDGSPSASHPTFSGNGKVIGTNITTEVDDTLAYELTVQGSGDLTVTTA